MNIGFGTAAIGRPQYINIRAEGPAPAFELSDFRRRGVEVLEAAYQQGLRYVDTAPGYGIAEQIIAEWLQQHPHEDVELATKWGYRYTANFDPKAELHEIKEHSLSMLNTQWAFSRTLPHLSTLQIHSATFASGVLENDEVLNRLAEIRDEEGMRIGMSSSGADQMEVLQRALEIERNGAPLFEVFQVTYNMLDPSVGQIRSAFEGRRLVIKESLANGRLFPNEAYPHYGALYRDLQNIALRYEVGVDAVALRFVIDSLSPFMVLSGASTRTQLEQNLKAKGFRLTAEEIHTLQAHAVEREAYWSERKQMPWN